MRLDRVEIMNFRSVADVVIPLSPPCRILVGINESGKSNILRALSLLDPAVTCAPDDVREFGTDEPPDQGSFVDFIFKLERSERLTAYERVRDRVASADINSVPILQIGQAAVTLPQLFARTDEIVHRVNVRTNTRSFIGFAWDDSAEVAHPWFQPTPGAPASTLITRPEPTELPLSSALLIDELAAEGIPSEHLRPLSADALFDIVVGAVSDLVADTLPKCVSWRYTDSHLLPPQIDIALFAQDPSICLPLKRMFELADFQDAGKAIRDAQARSNGMRNLLKRVGDTATEHMHRVWGDYRGLRIQLLQNGQHIDATILDAYNVYNLERRSDGFKRFITFLLLVSASARKGTLENTLYLHDEPDLSLHPSAVKYLRDELIRISASNFVVCSTHSIFMVDRENVSRHLIVKKTAERTFIEEVTASNITDEEVIYNALGHSLFEGLSPLNLVFEGWRDKRVFRMAASPEILAAHGFGEAAIDALVSAGTCHAKGVKDIGRVTPLLELAGKRWVVVSDGDSPAQERQRSYDGEGPWRRYDELADDASIETLEDFVRPEALRRAAMLVQAEEPELPELGPEDLVSPRLRRLQTWLAKGGIRGEHAKKAVNRIKEEVSAGITLDDLEPTYFTALKRLAEVLIGVRVGRPQPSQNGGGA